LQPWQEYAQRKRQEGLLSQASEVLQQPGGGSFQDLMAVAREAPDPMNFMNNLTQLQQLRKYEIMQKAGSKIARMLDDGKFSADELRQIDEEFQLGPANIARLAKMVQGVINPQKEGYTLSPGQVRFEGSQPIAMNPEAQDTGGPVITLTNPKTGKEVSVRRDSKAADQLLSKGFVERTTGKTLQDQFAGVGTIPPGYQMAKKDGKIIMEPIPGGPAARDIAEQERKREAAADVKGKAAQTVFEDTDRALDIVDQYGGFATGVAGISDVLPTTPAHQLRMHIESVKGNIGVDKLLDIKASGAGLGHIPQAQLEMLSSLLGKLNTKMKADDLKYNLKRIQEIYGDIVEKTGGDPLGRYQERQQQYESGRPHQPKSADEYLKKFE
jgi:hypothetical protein